MSPPLSVTFKMSTDEGQCGKQCNYKYLDPTIILGMSKEPELHVMNPFTNSSVPCVAFFLCPLSKTKQKKNKTQKFVRHSFLKAGNLNETIPSAFIMYKHKKRKYT